MQKNKGIFIAFYAISTIGNLEFIIISMFFVSHAAKKTYNSNANCNQTTISKCIPLVWIYWGWGSRCRMWGCCGNCVICDDGTGSNFNLE